MPTSEQGLRSAAEKLAEPMKAKGFAKQYESLMLLIDRAEELDAGMVVCLSNFFLRPDVAPLREDEELKDDINALLSIVAAMMAEFVNRKDERLLAE